MYPCPPSKSSLPPILHFKKFSTWGRQTTTLRPLWDRLSKTNETLHLPVRRWLSPLSLQVPFPFLDLITNSSLIIHDWSLTPILNTHHDLSTLEKGDKVKSFPEESSESLQFISVSPINDKDGGGKILSQGWHIWSRTSRRCLSWVFHIVEEFKLFENHSQHPTQEDFGYDSISKLTSYK